MDSASGSGSAFSPLETAPPELSMEAAAEIASSVFGVTGSPSPLDSERDLNLRISSDDGRQFLLKFANPADDHWVLDMQTKAMLHIASQDSALPVMRPLPSLSSEYSERVQDAANATCIARLFTFLPGTTIESADVTTKALEGFGAMVAAMGVALRGFFHPAGGYRILWDLKHTLDLRRVIADIDGGSHRDIVQRVLATFEERVSARLSGLRAQIIHNDLTLDNVLLDPSQKVSGIVDFGDLTHTALICDLAVTLVSMMWGRSDPLEAAESAISGYRSVMAVEADEAELLGDLVAARLAALVTIAAWRVRRYPENAEYITANVDLAWDLLERLDEEGLDAVRLRLAAACSAIGSKPNNGAGDGSPRPPLQELIQRRQRVLGPALSPLTYDRPLHLVRGEGSRLFDRDGNAYLDAYNNVPVVGHSHPHVVRAIAEQSALLNTNTRYLHESAIELAERLIATMPEGLDTVMFVNSGSEANDLAWRFATTYTQAGGAIVTSRAYHGVTTATLAFSPEEWVGVPAHVERVPAPDGYRGRYRDHEEGWAERYARHVDDAIAALNDRGVRPAAFYVDSLYTSDGIFSPPPAYMQEVAMRLHSEGCLLVADEVQSGYGRAGSHLWSFELAGITPDLVTLGKPMGNGHPVAAMVTRKEIAERLASETDVFSTFGGNPVACRAALAVLDVLEKERLRDNALEVGAHLRAGLRGLMDAHSAIGDVRGAGLMVGLELVADREARTPDPELAGTTMNLMRDKGVLVGSTGSDDNVLKIRPPLVFSFDDAEQLVRTLDVSLLEAHRSLKSKQLSARKTT